MAHKVALHYCCESPISCLWGHKVYWLPRSRWVYLYVVHLSCDQLITYRLHMKSNDLRLNVTIECFWKISVKVLGCIDMHSWLVRLGMREWHSRVVNIFAICVVCTTNLYFTISFPFFWCHECLRSNLLLSLWTHLYYKVARRRCQTYYWCTYYRF